MKQSKMTEASARQHYSTRNANCQPVQIAIDQEATQMTWLQRFTQLLGFSGNDDQDSNKEGRGRKVPSGFDKILKRTKRGIRHDKKEEESKSEQGE